MIYDRPPSSFHSWKRVPALKSHRKRPTLLPHMPLSDPSFPSLFSTVLSTGLQALHSFTVFLNKWKRVCCFVKTIPSSPLPPPRTAWAPDQGTVSHLVLDTRTRWRQYEASKGPCHSLASYQTHH